MNLVEILLNKYQKISNLWKKGQDKREPVARFLRTYSIFPNRSYAKRRTVSLKKQKMKFFSREEEQDMLEQFQSISAIAEKVNSLLEDIGYLESQNWAK